MPNIPTFCDAGTYNLRDVDNGLIVGKAHVEPGAADIAGGRGYTIHIAMIKASTGEAGHGVWAKPTQQLDKPLKWEGTGESLAAFIGWMHDASRKSKIRYVYQGCREQDVVP